MFDGAIIELRSLVDRLNNEFKQEGKPDYYLNRISRVEYWIGYLRGSGEVLRLINKFNNMKNNDEN
jgi:hypothetical protein